MPRAILITDEVHPLLIEGLQHDGFEVHYLPQIKAEEVPGIIHIYEGFVVNSKTFVGKEIIDRATQLKFVCRIGSGLDVIDLDYARQKNIIVFNSPEGNRVAVAEHTLALLLNMMNNICIANAHVKQGMWKREENRGTELSGKTIALIAFGNTAQSFAKLLQGFDVKILAYDKYFKGFHSETVHEAGLEQIFEETDVLSLHLPLTKETEYMIDYGFLSRFKKPIWFINTSRGKVLRTKDMLRCISEKKIIAAALDVLENEKLNTMNDEEKEVFNQLITSGKIILTPHVAGWTHESKKRIAEVLLQKIRDIYQI